jgi:Domain of unknown function (DUF4864)
MKLFLRDLRISFVTSKEDSMRLAFAATLAGILAFSPLSAQEADSGAIQTVIQGQMDAFTAKDPVAAFTFASPMIKGMFGSPDNFGSMVSSSYPMIWSPTSVKYLGTRQAGAMLLQRVLVTDASGKSFLFDYDMVEVPPDGWKINGVYPVPDAGAGA